MGVVWISIGALCCYLAGAVGQCLRSAGYKVAKWMVLSITAVGLTFHTAALYVAIHTDHGINLGLFTMWSLAALVVTAMVLLSSVQKPSESLLVLILPISMVAITQALLAPVERIVWNPPPAMVAHVLISVMAYGILMVATCQAVLLSYQEHQLRTHRHTIRTLPPLQTMERLLFEFLVLGVVLLTLSLGSGFFFLEDMFAQRLVHKTVLSITAWCLFAALLVGHWRFGWRGQKAVRWTLAGGAFLVLAYFGSRLVVDCLLSGQSCW